MDHDSSPGPRRCWRPGGLIGIATTVGFELRVSFAGTPFAGRKINNPDSETIIYMMIHGIAARRRIAEVRHFLGPVQEARNRRNRRMVESLNAAAPRLRAPAARLGPRRGRHLPGLRGRHDHRAAHPVRGGQRHRGRGGQGEPVVRFVEERDGHYAVRRQDCRAAARSREPALVFDLLGVLKSSFLEQVFIQPGDDECPRCGRGRASGRIGAIPVYAYLGDVTDSPTGDKKAEQFEDATWTSSWRR